MVLQSISHLLALGFGFFVGVFTLFGYMLYRMMGNDDWDDSNITNAERLLSHVVLHPVDFSKMYYLTYDMKMILNEARTPDSEELVSPFWYITEDEFQGVVKTRPPE